MRSISTSKRTVAWTTAMATATMLAVPAMTVAAGATTGNYTGTQGVITQRIFPPKVYKPHETVQGKSIWLSSNERDGKGGITVFNTANNKVMAKAIIDGKKLPLWNKKGGVTYTGTGGAEGHPWHPHGIAMSADGNYAYQVLEHSGLRWNKYRTGFVKATKTDFESGLLVVWNIKNPTKPTVVGSFLTGHAPHEAAVDPTTGWVYVGNHEDSPKTIVPNWTSVFNPVTHKYGFIDTGYWQAQQGIWWSGPDHLIKSISHVGEKMYAYKSGVWPKANAKPTASKRQGWNTVAYTVPLRASFVNRFPGAAKVMGLAPKRGKVNFKTAEGMPMVLHFHDLTVNESTGTAYMVVHSVHHAEHTGTPAEARLARLFPEPPETAAAAAADEETEVEHFNGRWMAVVTPSRGISWVDMSHGYGVKKYPNVEDVYKKSGKKGRAALRVLENSFVHGHFLDVAPDGTVVVSGEHTGNVGLVRGHKLVKVVPVSILKKNAKVDSSGFFGEPHLHGVNIDQNTGTIYLADEGEENFREGVFLMK